jgi:hypothetical protein
MYYKGLFQIPAASQGPYYLVQCPRLTTVYYYAALVTVGIPKSPIIAVAGHQFLIELA